MKAFQRFINAIHTYRRFLIVVTHFLFIVCSYVLAFYVRFDFDLSADYLQLIKRTLPVLILIKMPIFLYFGLFEGLWRYVSLGDLWQIIKAQTVAMIVFIAFIVFHIGLIGFPRSVFIIDWIFCITLVSGARLLTLDRCTVR